jgi:signal transduction histidine kinase
VLVVLALFAIGQSQVWSGHDDLRGMQAALVAAYSLPLLAARRRPTPVAVVVALAAFTEYQLDFEGGQAWFAVLLAVYALGRYATPREAAAGLVAVAMSVLAVDIPRLRDSEPLENVVPGWVVIALIFGLGSWIRTRQAETANLLERAESLEREREEATRAAVADERARIARELHDLVAHSMAVTVVQSQGAQRVLEADPAAARDAMAAIERLSRQGLDELRRLLGLLKEHETESPLDPPPSLARLDELISQLRQAGLDVTVYVDGERNGIPAGVDLSAYRVVQEGLTNALKHAGTGARVEVGLTYRPNAVEVVVVDDGGEGEAGVGGAGRGLIGMRERVALYGGSLEAAPRPGGGFELRARLPWGATT